jgi:hypothetical protein
MRLLDTLIKKRDHHRALAAKFDDLIAVLAEDEDVQKMVHRGKLSIANGAKVQFDALNGTTPLVKRKGRRPLTPKEREAQGRRMKKLWKTKRALMLKALAIGRKKSLEARRRQKRAEAEALAMT